jgi:hypothetical protein
MRHANRKPKAGREAGESAMSPAQAHGHCSVNGRGSFMRRKLALGILLMAVIGVTDLPSCDSGCGVRAEEAPPVVKGSDHFPIAPANETAGNWPPQSDWRYMPEQMPRLLHQKQRGPLRGDFWTNDELRRLLDSPAEFGR